MKLSVSNMRRKHRSKMRLWVFMSARLRTLISRFGSSKKMRLRESLILSLAPRSPSFKKWWGLIRPRNRSRARARLWGSRELCSHPFLKTLLTWSRQWLRSKPESIKRSWLKRSMTIIQDRCQAPLMTRVANKIQKPILRRKNQRRLTRRSKRFPKPRRAMRNQW